MVKKLSTTWLLAGVAVAAIVGFLLKANNKVLAMTYDRYAVALAMQFVAFIIMALVVISTSGLRQTLHELSDVTLKHGALIVFGGIGGLALFLVSMRLLITEDIGHMSILDVALDALIAVLGGYLIFKEKVTPTKIAGMGVILAGAYITTL